MFLSLGKDLIKIESQSISVLRIHVQNFFTNKGSEGLSGSDILFMRQISHISICTQTYYITKDDLELLFLLPPLPKCQDYRAVPTQLAYSVLRVKIKPRSSSLLGKLSNN